MLDPEVLVNLFPQVCVGMDLVNHSHCSFCVYLGAAAIVLANKMIGQMAVNRINAKATNSDEKPGCAL
jgi:hypothetical protein